MAEGAEKIAVSVIIPCRDRIDMVADVLDAIRNQTFDPDRMELIIVDGESTDPIEAKVKAYAEEVNFAVRYERHSPDNGPVSKRNRAAELARGEILAFTDSDCRPVPDWLTAGLAPFDDPKVGFVSGPVTYKPEQKAEFFSKLSAETLVEHPTYPTANMFYRRALFLEKGGFDTTLGVRDFLNRATECADTDLAWNIKKAGWSNVFADKALVYHEIEQLTPFKWLMEPTRLILLPLLLKLHPEISPLLLRFNAVFYRGTLLIYFGVIFVLFALILYPPALWAVPLGLAVLTVRRAKSISFSPVPRALGEMDF
ncbi:MAG: glycosyltransferase, partial [Pseudomonadota bacterium]